MVGLSGHEYKIRNHDISINMISARKYQLYIDGLYRIESHDIVYLERIARCYINNCKECGR